jgi:hypothetical protein
VALSPGASCTKQLTRKSRLRRDLPLRWSALRSARLPPLTSPQTNGHKLDEPASFSGRCIDLEGGSRGRDFRIYPGKGIVSISTVEGRKKLSYRCGDFPRGYLESPDWKIQSAKLVYKRRRKGWRYELHVTVIREESEQRAGGVLGVDTGRRYLAVATTGDDAHFFPAGHLKPKKEHCRRIRGKLKSKGTRSSTRTFNRVAGRGARLVEDMQHCTAKELVRLALESGCGAIAVERLNGIRARTGARGRKARYHHSTWLTRGSSTYSATKPRARVSK